MKRFTSLCLLATLLAIALLAGCNSESDSAADTPLDRFIARIRQLPESAAMDSLQIIADGAPPQSTFAKYELGNRFYRTAEDTAAAKGWNDAEAKAALDEAESWFSAAVAADSTFVEAWVNLGGIWDSRADMLAPMKEREARTDKAREMYEHALAVRPQDEKARCNLGALYMRQRKTEDAKNEFMTVLEQNPESALAHYHLAVLFAEAQIYREAEVEWKAAVKYDPDGDIGERSAANLKILEDLQKAQDPAAEEAPHAGH